MESSEQYVLVKTLSFRIAKDSAGTKYVVTDDEQSGNLRVTGGAGRLTFENATSGPEGVALRITVTTWAPAAVAPSGRLRWPFEQPEENPFDLFPGGSRILEINGPRNSANWSGLMLFKYTVAAVDAGAIRPLDPSIIIDN